MTDVSPAVGLLAVRQADDYIRRSFRANHYTSQSLVDERGSRDTVDSHAVHCLGEHLLVACVRACDGFTAIFSSVSCDVKCQQLIYMLDYCVVARYVH